MMHTRVLLMTLAVGATMVVGCGDDSDATKSTPSVTQVGPSTTPSATPNGPTTPDGEADAPSVASVVAATAQEPIALLPRPGDDGHLWLAERSGRVRRLAIASDGDMLTSTGPEALDISDQTTTDAERGLLGMAFADDGSTIFLSYTNLDGATRVVSYAFDGDQIDEASRAERFAIDQPYANHNGGHIVVGPDGQLWLGLGDGGAADDPENRAQDPSTELGKIIRINLATDETEIVVSGARNPWRIAFDTDGSLWVGDVGQNAIEEVNHLPVDEIDGANLGWSGFEGSAPYLDGEGRRPEDPVAPVFEYTHDGGNCSITGGFVYRGEAIPALQGAYLFADYCLGRVRAITLGSDGQLAQEFDLGIDVETPISFGTDQQGEAYVLSSAGNIVRLLAA